jgi:hypothetical protein
LIFFKKCNIDKKKKSKKICILKEKYLNVLNIQNYKNRTVHLSVSTEFNMQKRHPQAYEIYSNKISEVLSKPDYIGKSPANPNSLEVVKVFDDVVLVSVKINYKCILYITSMYIIGNHQLNSRIKNGRLIALTNY